MKLLILALLLSTTAAFAQSHMNRFTRIVQQADAMFDLHYCVLMADGIKVSSGIDGILWEGLDYNDVIQAAKKVDVTDMEIEEQIIESLQLSTIYKLEDCAKENLVEKVKSCEKLKLRATKLGLTKDDIKAELVF